MRAAFIGHSYHQKTRSTVFLMSILETLGTLDAFWETGWGDRQYLQVDQILGRNYDLIVLFQAYPHAPLLSKSRHPNVVFVPMYDACKDVPDRFWGACRNVKFLCLSTSLHERFTRLRLRTALFQYFPEPARRMTVDGLAQLRGFFWPRTRQLTWQDQIRQLIGKTSFETITLHMAPDPGNEVTHVSEQDVLKYRLAATTWFADHDEYLDTLCRHNVFFAPRRSEGIGMSFLEAMGMGMAVVAPDSPTMNEYIVDRVNGYLYNPNRPKPIDFSTVPAVAAKARETSELGYQRWLASLPRLRNFILAT